jgi:CheY-like chemotaxis protein
LAKTNFLAAASHDLRQPLQALAMFVTVLANRDHSPEDKVLIKRIEESASAVEALLNGLLDVSKLEAGLVVPVPASFRVSALLARLADEYAPLIVEAGLELRVVPCGATIRSDPVLLERILRNLLDNAVHYTKSGRILIGCRRRGRSIRIEVWDTGIGIPQSQIGLVFHEFHQLGNPGRDRRHGLGLGLAVVERLAKLLEHRIDVSSIPQKGSMFAIEVPLATRLASKTQCTQPTSGIHRHGATILVIEDQPDVRDGLQLVLESWGFSVTAAGDCEEALHHLSAFGAMPDLVLADYRLPGGATGTQAISRVRARLKRPLPAIILTGDTAPQRLRQAYASGHGLLHKPIQPARLRQMIDELLARSPAKIPAAASA